MRTLQGTLRWVIGVAVAVAACSPPTPTVDAGDEPADVCRDDAASDASRPDADLDAAADAGADAARDDRTEAGLADATAPAPDATDVVTSRDATPDAPTDARADAGGADAPTDARVDAAIDGGATGPCGAIGAITLPTGSVSDTLTAMPGHSTTLSCYPRLTDTSERVYTLAVTSRTGVQLSTDNPATTAATAVLVRTDCADIETEVACSPQTLSSRRAVARAVLDPGMYSVIVAGAGGRFRLDASTFTPAANATCATATPLTAGVVTAGTTANGGANNDVCDLAYSGHVFYAITVPPNSRLDVGMALTSGSIASAHLFVGCNPSACAGRISTVTRGPVYHETYDNPTATPRQVTLAVSGGSDAAPSGFTLLPTVTPLAPNAMCSAATRMSAGATEMGDTEGAATALGCEVDTPQLYYAVPVPANSQADLTLTRIGAQDVRARVADGCGAAACEVRAVTAGATPAPFFLRNLTGATRTFVVPVSSTSATTRGRFALRFVGVDALLASEICETATSLAPGSTTAVDTSGVGSAPFSCTLEESGPGPYYSVTVPPESTVTATLTRVGAQDAMMRSVDRCSDHVCSGSVFTFSDAPALLHIMNAGAAPRTFVLQVSSRSASTPARATLALSTAAVTRYTHATAPVSCDDLSAAAAVPGVTGRASTSARIALPFEFSFFGRAVHEYSVASSGYMQLWPTSLLGLPSAVFANDGPGSARAPNHMVAPFWDDLDVSAPASLRAATLGAAPRRRFVVEWNDARVLGIDRSDVTVRFQAKLFEASNVIEFHYCSASVLGPVAASSATITLEDFTGVPAPVSAEPAYPPIPGSLRLTPR